MLFSFNPAIITITNHCYTAQLGTAVWVVLVKFLKPIISIKTNERQTECISFAGLIVFKLSEQAGESRSNSEGML